MVENMNAFGPGFIPGKVEGDKMAVAQALGMRWSDQPAEGSVSKSAERPPSTGAPGVEGISTWSAI